MLRYHHYAFVLSVYAESDKESYIDTLLGIDTEQRFDYTGKVKTRF